MSLLPSIIRGGGVSAKLEKARTELAKADSAIAELQSRLASLDCESDDYPTTAQTLNAQISVQVKAVNILALQVAGLETKLAAEQAADAERRRLAAIKKAETELLPLWLAAVEKYVRSIKAERTAREQMAEARKAITAAWPIDTIEPAFRFYFDIDRVIHAAEAGADLDDLAAIAREQMSQLLRFESGPEI